MRVLKQFLAMKFSFFFDVGRFLFYNDDILHMNMAELGSTKM